MTVTTDWQKSAYIAGQAADARVNVELETEGMTLNIGPQHPATHGTLRIVVRLDGEQVVWADPIPGYMHRGYEKLTEVRTYPQVTTLVNRIDWLGSFANEVPFILAAEQLMGVEAPPRAQWIRTIFFEMGRIANITLFLGDMGVQLGAITPVFYAFRDREHVLNLIESATGGRFHPNFDRVGGIKDDLPKGWVDETKGVMKRVRTFCDEIEELLVGNEIFQTRTRGIGVIPPRSRLDYGLSGANLRASGVDWDLRRDGRRRRWPGSTSTGRCGPTPTATPSPATGCASRRSARPPRSSTSCSTDCRPGRSWPRSPHHQGSRRRGVGPHREPARRDGLLRRRPRATSARSGARSARRASTTSRSAVVAPGRLRSRHHHDPRVALLHPRRHRSLITDAGARTSPPTGRPRRSRSAVVLA